jgi:hypothetical protein
VVVVAWWVLSLLLFFPLSCLFLFFLPGRDRDMAMAGLAGWLLGLTESEGQAGAGAGAGTD